MKYSLLPKFSDTVSTANVETDHPRSVSLYCSQRLFYMLVLSLPLLFFSCEYISRETVKGNGDMVQEDRQVGSFSELQVAGKFSVKHRLHDDHSIMVEAESNLLEHIKTEMKGDRLEISVPQNIRIQPTHEIEIQVFGPALTNLSVLGSSTVLSDQMAGSTTKVSLNGSGRVFAEVEANYLEAGVNGSGQITLTGHVEKSKFSVNGSGTITATGMESDMAEASIRGSGEIFCFALSSLDASITGSGTVFYQGDPQIDKTITGSGSVVRN